MNRSYFHSDAIVGFVPKVVIRQRLWSREFSILVTDARSIFILKRSDLPLYDQPSRGSGLNVLLGGRAGSGVIPDLEDPDVMATDPRNFVVRHEWLEKVQLRKAMFGSRYELRFEYLPGSGRRKMKMRIRLVPPVASERSLGSGSDASVGYAKSVLAIYQGAFPGSFAEELLDWNL